MTNDMKKGLLPITTLVLNDLAIETGQLTAKQSRKSTSQILKLSIARYFYKTRILIYSIDYQIFINRLRRTRMRWQKYTLLWNDK
jgi:hypothetical protein